MGTLGPGHVNAQAVGHVRRSAVDAARAQAERLREQNAQAEAEQRPTPLVAALPPMRPVVAPNLDTDFWAERDHLTQIRDLAHARIVSPDALLGCVLARISALSPPTILLPPIVGTSATLDFLVAIVGPSGSGKSSASRLAADLLPIDDETVFEGSLGSGEGIAATYVQTVTEDDAEGKKRRVQRQVYRGALFHLDEGQALAEMGGRSGSTLLPSLRSAAMGERLGQQNADAERKRNLAPRSYRAAFVIGFQLETAAPLLDDAAGGTPQRFCYLSAVDPSIPDVAPPEPFIPWSWKPPVHQHGPMGIDGSVLEEIRGWQIAKARGGHVDRLDSHSHLVRLKTAGLLALLDGGRLHITADDWRLAGTITATSSAVRSEIAKVAAQRQREAEDAGIGRRVRQEVATAQAAENRILVKAAGVVARHVHRKASEAGHTCTRRCAQQAMSSAQRREVTVDDAIDLAIEQRWIERHDDRLTPGGSAPA